MSYQRILRDFNAFVDGDTYLGRVTAYTPPELSVTTNDYRAGGLDTTIPIDMGIEPLEATLTFGGFEPEAIKALGRLDAETTITVRGGLITDGAPGATPVIHTLIGKVTVANLGDWAPGESAANTITIKPTYFRVDHDGEKITEIDVRNAVRFVDGVDQLEALRDAIGR